jgi:hypothetical protein
LEDKNFETNKNFNISYNILSKTKKSNSKNDSDIPDEKYNSNNDEISNPLLINTNKISKISNYKTLEKFKINPKINISEVRKDNKLYKSNGCG